MNATTILPEIIGTTCDHRACTASVRVRVRLTTGELEFCMHHWVAVEEAIVATPAFLSATPAQELLAV